MEKMKNDSQDESLSPRKHRRFQSHRRVLGTLLGMSLVGFMLKSLPESYLLCSRSGNIYTVDEALPKVECISVRCSRIVDTGSFDMLGSNWYWKSVDVLSSCLPASLRKIIKIIPRVIHLRESSAVVPGLADAHAHVIENGYMMQLPLIGSSSIEEVVARIRRHILSHPDVHHNKTRWIEGMGWDQTKWPEARFPIAADLETDPLLKGRLIVLSRVDGHARWVSPAVLDLMQDLPEKVEGGLIVRGSNGKPTGIFVDNAMNLIPVPPWSAQQVSEFFDLTIKEALSYGLTSIHDADTRLEYLGFLKEQANTGQLPLRLYLLGSSSGEYWGDKQTPLIDYGKHGRLNFRGVKLYADGALGSWGAALLEPYSDKPESRGILLASPEELKESVHNFWRDGWQTGIHCIGDRANHLVLDIYKDLIDKQGTNVSEWRPRIEHAQIFAPEDLKRIGKLGVIASVQPTHATSDMWYAETRLGSERIKGAYAYQTLLQASPNGVLPLGSDFPVEGVNPLLGFYAATARVSVHGTSPHGPGGWFPDEKLTREQALKGMTLDAAYAAFAERDLGSLVPGKKADFVVLDRDIMTVLADEILETKVVATVVDGKVMYGHL